MSALHVIPTTAAAIAVTALTIGLSSPATGALQSLTVTGAVDFVASGSPLADLGLMIGDPIVAQAVFDDLFLTGSGFESVPLDEPNHSLDLVIGGLLSFDETDDVDFGFGAPTVEFQDGAWVGFSFITDPFLVGQGSFGLDVIDADVEIYNAGANYGAVALAGTLTTASISPN